MRTRLISGLALAGVCLLPSSASAASGDPQPSGVRLEGQFTMRGVLTRVHNVYGEHRGQRVVRTWVFLPRCAVGECREVTVWRRRSGRRLLDVVVLHRRARGFYAGSGTFWIALSCAGRIVRHGGLATERITVRITRTAVVGQTRLATGLKATYTNPSRVNRTRCPGGIGHDAARYQGARALPGPPTAAFTDTSNQLTSNTTFTDQSRSGANAPPIVAWSWNFGDPGSPDNTSTQRNPTHHYALPGTYTVTLAVRDRYGQTATATGQVTA